MSTHQDADSEVAPSAAARAEAAAWVARLHGPNRTAEVEAGLRRWLAEDPQHAAAFELLTDTWEAATRLRRRPLEQLARWQWIGFRHWGARAGLAAALTVLLAVGATQLYLHGEGVTTGRGELRTLVLEDGTRVQMNTRTRIVVRYDHELRRVLLDGGEAAFEVAKRPDWPFVVTAAGHNIRALGTTFLVRSAPNDVSVTLVEGRVVVSPEEAVSRRNPETTGRSAGEGRLTQTSLTLSPGERVTFDATAEPHIDRPSLERITAWQRNQVVLDHTPLAEAVAELNQYNTTPILIKDPSISTIAVSGVWKTGDSAGFALAIAHTYHLTVIEGRDQLVLTRETP